MDDEHRQIIKQRLADTQRDFDGADQIREKCRERRNSEIQRAITAELTLEEIAEATGLKRARIGQISKKARTRKAQDQE